MEPQGIVNVSHVPKRPSEIGSIRPLLTYQDLFHGKGVESQAAVDCNTCVR